MHFTDKINIDIKFSAVIVGIILGDLTTYFDRAPSSLKVFSISEFIVRLENKVLISTIIDLPSFAPNSGGLSYRNHS